MDVNYVKLSKSTVPSPGNGATFKEYRGTGFDNNTGTDGTFSIKYRYRGTFGKYHAQL